MRSFALLMGLLSTVLILSACKDDPQPPPETETPEITSASPLPGAYAGQPYSTPLEAKGGKAPLTFSVTSGLLPVGLTLSTDGTLGPKVNEGITQGTKSTFTVTVTDADGKTGTKDFELTTYQLPQLASAELTLATEGVDYRRSESAPESLQAQLGQGALTFSATGLPQGLSLDASSGVLTGTPAPGSEGTYSITVTVTDAGSRSASQTYALQVVKPQPVSLGGVVGLAPAGSRITDTLTVFAVSGRVPQANVGVRVRKNGQEYSPAKEALTDDTGKAVFTGLGLNGTTDTVDITANGKELTNTTYAGINASLVTVYLFPNTVLGARVYSSGAYDPSSRRFLLYGGYDSSMSNSLFYTQCFNDTVEAVDVAQKRFTLRVPAGQSTSPSPRYDAAMAVAGGKAVLFGGRNCIDTGDALGDTWEFDLATNTWAPVTPASSKPAPRRSPALVRDASGNSIYLVGGYRIPFFSNEVWRYEPATHTWSALPAAPFNRAFMGATTQTATGELWFCGGRGTPVVTAECQSFDPSTGNWTVRPSLPSERSDFPMAFDPFTETLYAFGGRTLDSTPFGDLLRLRKGATAWESVIPPGATPQPRYAHVMYFDVERHELVLGLGLTLDPATSTTTRLGDLWTYDGQAWTERGAAAPIPGYSVSGQVTGGPVNGTAVINLATANGLFRTTTATLDAQGHGTYTLSGISPSEPFFMTVSGNDYTLEFPKSLWNYTELQHAGLAANATVDIALPPGPAVLLQATGSFQLPAGWHNQGLYFQADPTRDVPGFPYVNSGVANYDGLTNQFSVAFVAANAPVQQRITGYLSSERVCEDHSLYTTIGAGTLSLPLSAPATGVSPGQPECIPQGPRGVGTARARASNSGAARISVADLDGDTFPDLLIPGRFAIGMYWGTPSLTSVVTDTNCCNDITQPHSVVAGDFNKDGKPDLAITEPATNSVHVLLASSSTPRSFEAPTPYPVGTSPSGLAAADVNGDGSLDLLVANQGDNTVSILNGAANGTFSAGVQVALAGTSPTQVLVTNLDGDNTPDLVVLVTEGLSIALDGTAQGPFGNSTRVTTGAQPAAVVVGRLNGDNLPDMAVANTGNNTVALLLGAGGGTFAQPVNIAALSPAGLALAEFTGDTHLDLAVSNSSEGTVTLYQGASNGTFVEHSKIPVPGDPRALVALDINADGLNDLAVASPTANGVYVLLGQKPAPTAPGNAFTFTAPANAGFMWSMHGITGHRRYWDYYAAIQPGPVSYSLPLPSTLAPSSAPVAPASGKLELTWTPWVKQWEPNSPRRFNPRQFLLNNLGTDAETQPGASHYFWP
ncbi:Kelch repeat-containing protein [Hyalangium versicolor]|uniref:Kelch repeat-containing protein n=1 Tax=Hyalangium versicolor TaxID=2861190 RepID=UPI001CCB73BF|nr:FG-GAP-like repeat-containing protein [Hyalangium versicolor]